MGIITSKDQLEPFPYGDHFGSVLELMKAVDVRESQKLSLYGHALIYPLGPDGMPESRIAARVNHQGDITVGAHCENI